MGSVIQWLRLLFQGESVIVSRLDQISRQLDYLGAIVSENQDKLNALADQLGTATDGIRQDIADLKAQPGADALDFTALDARVEALSALDAENPAPVDDGGI